MRGAVHGRALTHLLSRLSRLLLSRRRPTPPRPRACIPPRPIPAVRSPRTSHAYVLGPRSPVPGPRCPVAPSSIPSSHPCLVLSPSPLTCAAVDYRAPTLPCPYLRVPRHPRPHGRVSASMSARPCLQARGGHHGCNSRKMVSNPLRDRGENKTLPYAALLRPLSSLLLHTAVDINEG